MSTSKGFKRTALQDESLEGRVLAMALERPDGQRSYLTPVQALAASDIVNRDRAAFRRQPNTNVMVRDFYPGELELRAEIGDPVHEEAERVLVALSSEGDLTHMPITLEREAEIAAELDAQGARRTESRP